MSWGGKKKFFSEPKVCERDKWSEDKICRLVCLYKKFPCLWKKDNPSYMENSSRHSAYGSIHQGMDMCQITFTEVMIKIREVRRIYVSELQKILKARSSGRKYEPRQKWFSIIHNFLYENLDFDEAAELQGLEDSASSSYQEDEDEDSDDADDSDQFIDFDTLSRTDYNQNLNFESSKIEQCRKIPQTVPCDYSEAGSSVVDHLPQRKRESKHCPFLRVDSSPQKINYCPMKLVNCPQRESVPNSDICYKSHRSRKSNSNTIICDKKRDRQNLRCEKDDDGQWKRSGSMEQEQSTTLSYPRSSSIERFDSNESLNANSLVKTPHDEFDVFAKSVACQLRKMDIESAVMAQNQIQKVLTDQRLHRIEPIRLETLETKNLVVVEESPSSQHSITRVRSRVIKPTGSTSKRRISATRPTIQNSRKNEIRIVERPARGIIAKRLPAVDQQSQRKTKKGCTK